MEEFIKKAKQDNGHRINEIIKAVDIFVEEQVNEIFNQEKIEEDIAEIYENKWESYKEYISSEFDNFLNEELESVDLPEKILTYAKYGEFAEDFNKKYTWNIPEIYNLIVEVRDELKEIEDLNESLKEENVELNESFNKLWNEHYLNEKCDELTIPQSQKLKALINESCSKSEIDQAIEYIFNNEKKYLWEDWNFDLNAIIDEQQVTPFEGYEQNNNMDKWLKELNKGEN